LILSASSNLLVVSGAILSGGQFLDVRVVARASRPCVVAVKQKAEARTHGRDARATGDRHFKSHLVVSLLVGAALVIGWALHPPLCAGATRLLTATAGNHSQDQLQPQNFQHVTAENQ